VVSVARWRSSRKASAAAGRAPGSIDITSKIRGAVAPMAVRRLRPMVCPACGEEAPEGARFCASCGRSLLNVTDERRVVTVLFADIVGFTTLSERLDPELVKNLVDRCFNRLAQDVTAFG